MLWISTLCIISNILLQESSAVAPSRAITVATLNFTDPPTPNPTPQTTVYQRADTLDLINRGFNAFTAEISASSILDFHLTESNASDATDGLTNEHLEFDAEYDAFSDWAAHDARTVDSEYDINDFHGSYGSLSLQRKAVRLSVTTTQYYIFSMRLRIPQKALSWGLYNAAPWNSYFINSLSILPQEYSGEDDLDTFRTFWNTFGTHIFKSINLGGIVEGVVVADKCSVTGSFGNDTHYMHCLNAQYHGYDNENCNDSEIAIANKHFRVRGGDEDTFETLLSQFHDEQKVTEIEEWMNSLSLDTHHVVGGLVHGIWHGIEQATLLGNHTLNRYSSKKLSDDEWRAIAEAMESAYDDYAEQLDAAWNVMENGECDGSIDCHGGIQLVEDCVCIDCGSPAQCCGLVVGANSANSKVISECMLIFQLSVALLFAV